MALLGALVLGVARAIGYPKGYPCRLLRSPSETVVQIGREPWQARMLVDSLLAFYQTDLGERVASDDPAGVGMGESQRSLS